MEAQALSHTPLLPPPSALPLSCPVPQVVDLGEYRLKGLARPQPVMALQLKRTMQGQPEDALAAEDAPLPPHSPAAVAAGAGGAGGGGAAAAGGGGGAGAGGVGAGGGGGAGAGGVGGAGTGAGACKAQRVQRGAGLLDELPVALPVPLGEATADVGEMGEVE